MSEAISVSITFPMSVSHHPPVLWAQRKDKLFITIDVQDCVHPKLKLEKLEDESQATLLKFSGVVGDGSSVEVLLELHDDVNSPQAKVSVTGRHVLVVVPKKTEGFWPRLTKHKQPRFVSVDWSKWVDEDEENEAPEFDMNSLGQLGGLEQFDSDDDEDEEEGEPSGVDAKVETEEVQETETDVKEVKQTETTEATQTDQAEMKTKDQRETEGEATAQKEKV